MIWGGGGNFRNEFIFSREPLPFYFLVCGEGPQNFFFSISSAPPPLPQIITGRPLTWFDVTGTFVLLVHPKGHGQTGPILYPLTREGKILPENGVSA